MNKTLKQPHLIRNLQIFIVILTSFFADTSIIKSATGATNLINKLILVLAIRPKRQPDCSHDKSILSLSCTLDFLNELRQLATGE